MARLVRHEATGPIEIKPQEKSVWICGCGLSGNPPFCDGSHNIAKKNDQPGKVCIYAKDLKTVTEVRDDV